MSTLKQMRERVQDASDRQIGSSDTQVNALINDSYLEVAMLGRLTLTSVTLTLIADQGDYSLATASTGLGITDCQAIKEVVFSGNGPQRCLQPTSIDEILNLRGASPTGSPPYLYSFEGDDMISFYPTPTTGDVGVLWYYKRPALLVVDADEPPAKVLPAEFHDLIVLRALAQSSRNIGKGKPGWRGATVGLHMAQQYQQMYQDRLVALKRWRNRMYGSRTQMAQIGPPRRPRYANDIYFGGDYS